MGRFCRVEVLVDPKQSSMMGVEKCDGSSREHIKMSPSKVITMLYSA